MPQFLLRNFRGGAKPQVHVFDKHAGTSFKAAVSKVAAEKGFYDVPQASAVSLEPMLAFLEAAAAKVVGKILQDDSLASVSQDDRVVLSLFCAAQLVRVPHWRNTISEINRLMRDKLSSMGLNPHEAGLRELTEDQVKAWGLLWFKDVPTLTPHFVEKDWILLRAPRRQALYISDNPVVLHNTQTPGSFPNLGLAVRGIQIYLPLASHLCLGMLCPSHRLEAEATLKGVPSAGLALPPALAQARLRVERFATTLATSGTIELEAPNVEHLNSLQVRTSARFLYSAMANFDLAREMLRNWPGLRYGAKPTLM